MLSIIVSNEQPHRNNLNVQIVEQIRYGTFTLKVVYKSLIVIHLQLPGSERMEYWNRKTNTGIGKRRQAVKFNKTEKF